MASILIVDDDELMRTLLVEISTEAGHETVTADTSEDGVKKAEELEPDLIITDIFMPVQGGLELIRTVKEKRPDTRIIAVSGFDQRQDVDVLKLAKEAGASECFQKPVHAQVLTETIQMLLEA